MDSRKAMLMGGALMVAAVSAITARNLFSSGSTVQAAGVAPVPVEPAGPEVLVATRALPVGTIVTPDAFRFQPWPKDLVEKAYFIKGDQPPVATAGSVVRYPITAGQPITQGALVKPGDRGFLAAALGPGMRAVTISVSAQAGVAGFVFPGDRVDLLLTSTVQGTGGGDPLKTSETIIRNLRVLATDQRTDKTTDDAGKTVVTAFSNVTLEVTPKLSEKIAVAQTLGALSLSLRSIADDRMELERKIAAGEVDVAATNDPKTQQKMLLQIASQPSDSGSSFTTGGEVSRFQRTSAPHGPAGGFAPGTPAPAPAPQVAVAAPSMPPRPRGPVVEVIRGDQVVQVAVGGN